MATCRSSPLVPVLLQCGSPCAVFGFVVSIVIPAFYAVFPRRTWPHISVKAAEIIKPLVANLNSTTAIIGIFRVLGICASPSHVHPHRVFWNPLHSVSSAPVSESRYCAFGASGRYPQGYTSLSNAPFGSTITQADQPSVAFCGPVTGGIYPQYGKIAPMRPK